MKKYIAIGHYRGSPCTANIISTADTMKDFRSHCLDSGFTPWVIISERRFSVINSNRDDPDKISDEVVKLTTAYWRWSKITEYIMDHIETFASEMVNA